MDALANFAYSTVATAPSPATSGTTLIVHAGDGAKFPAAPFDLLIWPVNATPLTSNAEIARCTNVSTDTLTITRAQYGTSARTVVIGDQCCQPTDANLFAQVMQLNPGPMLLSGTPSAGQVPVATSGTGASWSTPAINSAAALGLSLTETINYPPVGRLQGNTGFLEQQNPTMGRLPPVTGIVANGTIWTITFSTSILGTLGSVGDTFQIWLADFVPSGWNFGSEFGGGALTATITGTGTTVTVPNVTSPASITTYGLAYNSPIITTGGPEGPGGEYQLEGTTTFNRSLSAIDGLGPALQTQKAYTNGTVYTATWTITNGSNLITIAGDQRATLYDGLYLIAGAGFPLNSTIGNVYYDGSLTNVKLYNSINGIAANCTAGSGSESLTFAAGFAPGEIYVGLGIAQGTQAGVPMIINPATFAGPGAGQGWGDAFSLEYHYNNMTNVMDCGLQFHPTYNASQGQLRLGNQIIDPVFSPAGSLGFQVGTVPLGILDYNIPNATVAPSDDGTALSSLSTLALQLGSVLFPTQGSAVLPASDGMHIVSWTGQTGTTLGTGTLTGCTYSGNTAATAIQGALVTCLPNYRQPRAASPAGLYGTAYSAGLVNPASTFHIAQAPATTITAASNGVVGNNLGTVTGTVNSADNGTAFSSLGTLTLNASTTAFGSSGIGTIKHSGVLYVFSWTGQSGSTLTGCVYSGLQTTTVATNDVVVAGAILNVDSLQWFPDTSGNLAIASSNLYGYFTYAATTGTRVIQASATALSSLSTLIVSSTASCPVAGTGTLQCSDGPHTVTWTGIGSATTFTGCTYSGSTAATVITGSQLWLSTVVTGPVGMAQSFLNCTSTGGNAITFVTGMQVLGLPGGNHQSNALPAIGNLLCVGPGFTLPLPVTSKMSVFTSSVAVSALLTPMFGGINPPIDGQYIEVVNSKVSGGSTLTFTSNLTSAGTNLSLGAGTRAVTQGGLISLRWDAASGTKGEWVEISASNLGSHG